MHILCLAILSLLTAPLFVFGHREYHDQDADHHHDHHHDHDHGSVQEFPTHKHGHISHEHLHLGAQHCQSDSGVCGFEKYKLPHHALRHSSIVISVSVLSEHSDANVCLSLVSTHKHHDHHDRVPIKVVCGSGHADLCVQEDTDHKLVVVSVNDEHDFVDEHSNNKVEYSIKFEPSLGHCDPKPCKNNETFEELCSAEILLCDTEDVQHKCKKTCSERGVRYHKCGTPTPTPELSLCQQLRGAARGLIGEYIPQCEEDGSFSQVQCHPSTGYCWCVISDTGFVLSGTHVPPGLGVPNCEASDDTDTDNSETDDFDEEPLSKLEASASAVSTHGSVATVSIVSLGAVGLLAVVLAVLRRSRQRPSLSSQDDTPVPI